MGAAIEKANELARLLAEIESTDEDADVILGALYAAETAIRTKHRGMLCAMLAEFISHAMSCRQHSYAPPEQVRPPENDDFQWPKALDIG